MNTGVVPLIWVSRYLFFCSRFSIDFALCKVSCSQFDHSFYRVAGVCLQLLAIATGTCSILSCLWVAFPNCVAWGLLGLEVSRGKSP